VFYALKQAAHCVESRLIETLRERFRNTASTRIEVAAVAATAAAN
jgi:hypothetical protein